MFKTLTDTSRIVRDRLQTHNANSPWEVAGNRSFAMINTTVIGGSIAAIILHYFQPPPDLRDHAVALVVFGWQTFVYTCNFLWIKFVDPPRDVPPDS